MLSSGNAELSASLPVGPYPLGNATPFPNDVFLQIVNCFTPKELNTLCLVSKVWYNLISDRKLWVPFLKNHQQQTFNSIIFAETRLWSGFPLRKRSRSELSYKHIYNEREKMKGALIIDAGTGICKIGFSKYDIPSVRLDSLEDFATAQTSFKKIIRRFFETCYASMWMAPSMYPVFLSVPVCVCGSGDEDKYNSFVEAVTPILYHMKVPAICTMSQSSLALLAHNLTSGILLNIGFSDTRIYPVFRGETYTKVGMEMMKVGATTLDIYLHQRLSERYPEHVFSFPLVSRIKESLCYVAPDYNQELNKSKNHSFNAGAEGIFTLNRECFEAAEILFNPLIDNIDEVSLHKAVAKCIIGCHIEACRTNMRGDKWFKTIVLTGGTSLLCGLAERLKKELLYMLPPSISEGISVIPSPYGGDAAWHGAKLVSSVTTFEEKYCKKVYVANPLK